MDEQHSPARVVDPRTLVMQGAPPAREPFDPALLLEGRRPPPLPYATGPIIERAVPFDPAAHLGERARRGAFDLSTVKPITITIGGAEMVAVPSSAYDDAVRRLAAQEQPAPPVEQTGKTLDAAAMLDLLLSLHAAEVVSTGQLVAATGLDHLDIGNRIAAFATRPAATFGVGGRGSPVEFVTPPEVARVDVTGERSEADAPEAHGAALDDGSPSEEHGAALAATKPGKQPRGSKATREVP